MEFWGSLLDGPCKYKPGKLWTQILLHVSVYHVPLFCRLHHLPPDVAFILAFVVFLAVPFRRHGVGGRNVGSVGEAGGQPKHPPGVFILSLTRCSLFNRLIFVL